MNDGSTLQFLPYQELSKLMRRQNFLYSGPFADHLNLDMPYVTQQTLARTTTGQQDNRTRRSARSSIPTYRGRYALHDR